MHIILLIFSGIAFMHALRDYLQIKGVNNWFTTTFHLWDAPQYEKHSLILFLAIGILCLVGGLINLTK